MQVIAVVAAKVTKARMKKTPMAMIKVPHMLHEQLSWHKRSPPAHPTLSLEVRVSTSEYEHVGAPTPPATRRRTTTLKAIADALHKAKGSFPKKSNETWELVPIEKLP